MAENWKITGTYFETCNCETACPCLFLSPPTSGDCTAMLGWHIDQGNIGGVDLSGFNTALAVHAPGHMAQVKWEVALYVDERASGEQQTALTQIFAGQAGGHFGVIAGHVGEVLGAGPAAIEYKADGKKRSLTIGGVADVALEAIEGQGGGEVILSGHPLAVAPGQPGVVGRNSNLSYHDHGMDWDISGGYSLHSPFDYQGP